MSRGGRPRGGGARRGRKTGSLEAGWNDEPGHNDTKPMPLFPETIQSTPRSLSQKETGEVAAYRSFREHMHDGPIYTILDTQSLRDEEGFPAVKQFNPFEGVERYSLKYKKLKRTLPNLRTRSYVKELFPSELWSTLDPDLAAKDRKNPNPSKPFKPQVRLAPFLDSGDRGENPLKRKTIADEDEQDEEEDIQPRGRRKKNPTDDDDNPIYDQDNPDEEAEDQVDRDSEFEESDDNEGDDYNAEQYFDAGDDDEGDYDGGGGGEDDGGYY